MDTSTPNHEVKYATDQNNIGVHCFLTLGKYDDALNHFRSALAAKLSDESRITTNTSPTGTKQDTVSSQQQQQQQLHNNNNDDENRDEFVNIEPDHRCVTPDPSEDVHYDHLECVASGTEDYIPYLYFKPFSINAHDKKNADAPTLETGSTPGTSSSSSSSTPNPTIASIPSTIMCAKIIFNVGLTYQAMDRTSRKACSIYQIAHSLLSALPLPYNDSQSLLLHTVTLNNFGVWCYENQEYDAMASCFEDLVAILDETICDNDSDNESSETTVTLPTSVKRGIFRNLRACLAVST